MSTHGDISFSTTELFDKARYPIDRRESAAYGDLVSRTRAAIGRQNCARLSDFLRPEALAAIKEEAVFHRPHAVFHKANLNPYFTEPPAGTPADHPLMWFAPRQHGMIRGDRFARNGITWTLFQNPDLCAFVADCLGFDRLYPYPDPFGCVNVNVQPHGREFSWHFDTNDFTVSIGLHQCDEGGVFEYVPDIRTEGDENYDAVKAVLDGGRDHVRSLVLRPGDLQLFRGGYTLHRVTAPEDQERLCLLLSYVADPSHVSTPEEAEHMWGEAHPLHHARAAELAAQKQ